MSTLYVPAGNSKPGSALYCTLKVLLPPGVPLLISLRLLFDIFLYLPFNALRKNGGDLQAKMFKELSEEYSQNTIMLNISKSFIGYADDHWKIVKEFGRYPHKMLY